MNDLVEFLLARIAEDESDAASFTASFLNERMVAPGVAFVSQEDMSGAQPGAWGRIRVLAECEAKRRIVARNAPLADIQVRRQTRTLAGETLALLALPYADHPDYRQEWML